MIAYDTKANKFVKCTNMKERRMHHAATVINNKLYVTGGRFLNGHDVIEDSDCFECYDPKTDVWTSKGSLPYKLFDHGSLSLICVSNRPNPPWLLRERNISAWASRSLPCSLREMRNMGPQLRLETIWGRLHSFVGWVHLSCGFDGMLLVLASICAVLNQKRFELAIASVTVNLREWAQDLRAKRQTYAIYSCPCRTVTRKSSDRCFSSWSPSLRTAWAAKF